MRSGGDLAAIDGDFDFGTVLLDAADMAPDARLEHRPQRRADLGRKQRLKGGALKSVKVERAVRNFTLPFEALEQLGLALGALDGLHVAPAAVANAQIDAEPVQRAIGRVEIGGDELLILGRAETCCERGMGGDARGVGRIELELELHLHRLARRVTSHNASHCSDATPSPSSGVARQSQYLAVTIKPVIGENRRASRRWARGLCQALNLEARGSARSTKDLRRALLTAASTSVRGLMSSGPSSSTRLRPARLAT